jgi:hypothetical protein
MNLAKRSRLSIPIAALLAVIAFLSLTRSVQAQNPGVLVIEIRAKKCEYSTCPVHLRILSGAFEPIRLSSKGSVFKACGLVCSSTSWPVNKASIQVDNRKADIQK